MNWIALLVLILAVVPAAAQAPVPSATLQPTRFTVAAAPLLFQPKGEFRSNVGDGFGGGGALLYHLDRSGILSLRFDASGLAYGHETKRVPFSRKIGERIHAKVTTTNSIAAFSFGPELAMPRGPVRPYLNAALSGNLFRTTSSLQGAGISDEDLASTTNYSDASRAWVLGSGVRIPLGESGARSRLSLDLGVRYYRGGQASYLREGSIEDQPDGSVRIIPLNSRTSYVAYLIGIRFRIPFDSTNPCPRFLC